jgi:hypothetical protein
MRRTVVLLPVVAVVLLGLVVAGRVGPAAAQEGSPPAGGFEIAPGVTAEALAFAAGEENPALYRLTFAPGVVYEVEPAPEISIVYGESGSLIFSLDAPLTVARAGATDEPGEAVAAGASFTLDAGDYVALPPLVGGEVGNDGPEAASVVVANIVPSPATPAAATPAA